MGVVAAYAVPHPPLIVPEVGKGQEHAIQKTIDAYEEVARRVAAHAPEVVVVSSPHAPLFYNCFHVSTGDAAHGDLRDFGTWDASMNVAYDSTFVSALTSCARAHDIPICGSGMQDDELDHATFIPLYFVNELFEDYRLVRVGLSGLPAEAHLEFGRCIAETARDLDVRTVFIASGDLSHKLTPDGPYGFAPEGPVFDRDVVNLLDAGDLEGLFMLGEKFCESAAECGLGSLRIMAGVLEKGSFSHELLSYEGPFGVGYAVAAFEALGKDCDGAVTVGFNATAGKNAVQNAVFDAHADPFVALARASVEGFVRTGKPIAMPQGLSADLSLARAGVFVSLHEHGELRGCIGTIEPVTGSIAQEIIRNGVAAASEDPRFAPVREDELDYLSYSVDVLFPPELIEDESFLDPVRYGVIVSKGRRRGLLLPNLEGVDTVEEQVSIAMRKAGIMPDEDDIELERFRVVRHERGGDARRA